MLNTKRSAFFAAMLIGIFSIFSCTELDPHVDDPNDSNYVPTEINIKLLQNQEEVATATTEDSFSIALSVSHLHRIDRIKIDLDLNNADDEAIIIQADELSVDPDIEELVSLVKNHRFSQPGEYTIEVYAYSVNGQDIIDTFTVTIECGPPSFLTQPGSQETTAPDGVTFVASASGTAPVKYQWYRLTDTAGDSSYVFEKIIEADSAVYTIAKTLPEDENYQYACIATNMCGADTSRIVGLKVDNAPLTESNPTVSFRLSESSGPEGVNGSIALELDTVYTENDVVVRIAVMDNSTATYGEDADFTLPVTTITFKKGEQRAEANLNIYQDGEQESDENVFLKIESALFAHIDTTKRIHKYSILDDDEYPVVSFLQEEASGPEGIGVKIKIGLSETFPDDTVKVVIKLAPNNTAINFIEDSVNADFVFNTQTISFAPGIQEVSMDSIEILKDKIKENLEDFTLQLTLPETKIRAKIGEPNEFTYTIIDNNTARVLFDGSDKSITESDSGAIQDSIPVILSSISAQEVNVTFEIEATAQIGSDYSFIGEGSQVTFAPGQDTAYIRVSILGDTLAEGSEYIKIILTEVTEGYSLSPESEFTYFINDNDATAYTFEKSESVVYEDTGTFSIPVILTAPSADTVKIEYEYVSGSATTVDSDFEFSETSTRTLILEPGVTTKYIDINIVDDELDEPIESFSIELKKVEGNVAPGSIRLHTVKIIDNDKAKYRFQTANSEGDETDSIVFIPVVLSNPSSANAIRLKFRVSLNSTADAGDDYTIMAQDTLLFEIGDTLKSIEITLHKDEISETNETIELELEAADTFSVRDVIDKHVFTIRDADGNPLADFINTGMETIEGRRGESRVRKIPVCLGFSSAKTVTVDFQILDLQNVDSTLTWNGEDCAVEGEVNGIGTLRFEPMQDTSYISVTVFGDTIDENNESMKIQLLNPQNAKIRENSIYPFTVIDDDNTIYIQTVGGGSVSPSGAPVVSQGDSLRLIASPDPNHHFLVWESDSYSFSDKRNATSYILNITHNDTVRAHFGIDSFQVVVNQGQNGTIAPTYNDSLPYGTTFTIDTVTPAANHVFIRWNTSGAVEVSEIDSKDAIFTVKGSGNVTPVFELKGYEVIVKAGENGTVTNDSINNIQHGDNLVVTAVPDPFYHFVKWKVTGGISADMVEDTLDDTTTIRNIDGSGTITALFGVDKHIITVSSAGCGAVDPDNASKVNHFDSLRIRALDPDSAYHFSQWRIISGKDSADITDSLAPVTTVKNIIGAAEIQALFVKDTFNLFVTSDIYGTANDEGIRKIAFRESTTVSAGSADSAGYEFSHWGIGGNLNYEISAGDIRQHTALVKNLTGNDTVKAIYILKTCTLSVSANQYGTSDPSGDVFIQHFRSQTIRAANPAAGYEFTGWSILEGNEFLEIEDSDKDSTRIINITGNGSVRANFDRIRYSITVTSGEGGSAVNENINRNVPYMDTTHISIDETEVGWDFQQWVVDDDQKAEIDNPFAASTYIKGVKGEAMVTAVFARKRYPFTVIQPTEGGEIVDLSGNPLQSEYEHGTELILQVNLARGYFLNGWLHDGTGSIQRIIYMNGEKTVGVNLDEIAVPSHVICVDAESNYNGDSGNGTTWAKAFKKIENGLTALHDSTSRTQLWIAGGLYVAPNPDEGYDGFTIHDNDTLYGGFAGNENSLDSRIFNNNMTILDGEDNVEQILDMYGCSNTYIDGFLIENGKEYGAYMAGGGEFNKLNNCIFSKNKGVAVYVRHKNVEILNCIFRDNKGGSGCALAINQEGAGLKVKNSIFYNNEGPAIEDGNLYSTVENLTQFYNCTVYKNTSTIQAQIMPGGIYTVNGNVLLRGCIIYGNKNTTGSGGTQINSVYNVRECNIEGITSGTGIGDTIDGARLSKMHEHNPNFPETITDDNGIWYESYVDSSDGVLIPDYEDSVKKYGSYSDGRLSKDIRGATRTNGAFTIGAYEAD